ncbi:MAG: hypothetical protein KAI24_02995 [Planctomycetes bacterium]|nr:hypothetical protein [Planctomycetota bacterium]
MDTQRITLDPDPPVRGSSLEVCYDFDGSGQTTTTLRVTFDPGGQQTDHDVHDQSPCFSLTVPTNASSIRVEDLSGVSPTKTSPVVKPSPVPA